MKLKYYILQNDVYNWFKFEVSNHGKLHHSTVTQRRYTYSSSCFLHIEWFASASPICENYDVSRMKETKGGILSFSLGTFCSTCITKKFFEKKKKNNFILGYFTIHEGKKKKTFNLPPHLYTCVISFFIAGKTRLACRFTFQRVFRFEYGYKLWWDQSSSLM